MKYTPLSNLMFKGGWSKSKMLTVTRSNITFSCSFRQIYGLKRYITYFFDEDGYMCFKLSDEAEVDSYKITLNANGGYFVRRPSFLRQNDRLPIGTYNVTERDGFFVTDCKLNLEEMKCS